MPVVAKSALVPYSAQAMYELVDDIASYPAFLPWCRSTRILSRDDDEVKACIEMAKGALSKSFSTCNRLQPGKMIEIRLLDGPFRHLEGFWRFQHLEQEASKVSLDLEFEFGSRLLQLTVGPLFGQIADTMVDAFCKRARELYG